MNCFLNQVIQSQAAREVDDGEENERIKVQIFSPWYLSSLQWENNIRHRFMKGKFCISQLDFIKSRVAFVACLAVDITKRSVLC